MPAAPLAIPVILTYGCADSISIAGSRVKFSAHSSPSTISAIIHANKPKNMRLNVHTEDEPNAQKFRRNESILFHLYKAKFRPMVDYILHWVPAGAPAIGRKQIRLQKQKKHTN